ncbi:patatin-like phospholipase family protein [Jannaschia sp. S6380]|uniref:patatin-like phospholipase family protein n=1 Tax=Jannaschia sp. S6380 TaxID=2926408 RepID=UPI001FF4AB7C|nr:patatin-like phospholipase family protein [Jannaschia sp. S6380]MCK0168908.1 patatin-like phospholipase family protein [Jannaschia sp. S6380]
MRQPSIPRIAALLALTAVLAGCGLTRPADLSCPALVRDGAATTKSSQGDATPTQPDAPPGPSMMERTEVVIEDAIRAEVARAAPRERVTLQVVTLSAGGQYGAFGAGFLTGWSDNPAAPRPDFNLVTGVSAGAMMAPAVFAGSRFDPLLEQYAGLGADDVLTRRPLFTLLRAPSIASPAPLARFLDASLSPGLLNAIARGHADGRKLLIGATNIDDGTGEVFNLGAAADAPDAGPCLREAMLASAAIPALLPPRHINGALYADGGLRAHVFLEALEEARADVSRERDVEIDVEAYLIVNGALLPPEPPVADTLPAYAVRSVSILADEVLRDSILEAVAFAEARRDWRLRGIRAELAPDICPGTDPDALGGFDACLTAALFEHGRTVGRTDPIPWLDAGELRALAEEF